MQQPYLRSKSKRGLGVGAVVVGRGGAGKNPGCSRACLRLSLISLVSSSSSSLPGYTDLTFSNSSYRQSTPSRNNFMGE